MKIYIQLITFLFVLHGLITQFRNNSKQLLCSFIDISEAFDYVVRDILWFKLIKHGVKGKLLDIIVQCIGVLVRS